MELPLKLQNLYRHWDDHINTRVLPLADQSVSVWSDPVLQKDILWFINERLNIWKKKIVGEPSPYTQNPILSTYRFCNIFREFDRQTIEFHEMLNPLRGDFSLWLLNMFYCRMVAKTETVRAVGLLSFDPLYNQKLYERLMTSPRPRFGTPYVFPVSTILKSATPTRESFIVTYLPSIIGAVAEEVRTWNKISVYEGVEKVLSVFGYNHRFLWTEVLIDIAYQYPEYIDLFKEFPIGPGSLPTMKRINSDIPPSLLAVRLSEIWLDTGITYGNRPLRLSAENWEGIGCEYRKFTNLTSGKGRKRKYRETDNEIL